MCFFFNGIVFLFFNTPLYYSVHTFFCSPITQSGNVPGREKTGSIPIVIHSVEAFGGCFTLVHSCLSFHFAGSRPSQKHCLTTRHLWSRACHFNTPAKTNTQSHPKIQSSHKRRRGRLNMQHPNLYSASHNSAWALIFFYFYDCFMGPFAHEISLCCTSRWCELTTQWCKYKSTQTHPTLILIFNIKLFGR